MIHWIINFATGFVASTHHQNYDNEGHANGSAYVILGVLFTMTAVIGLTIWGATMDGIWGAFRAAPLAGLVWFWPYIALLVMAAVAIGIPAGFIYSWVRVIPSREERAEKVKKKIRVLRGELSRLS